MDYFEADVVTAQDYYPFDMLMPKWSDVGAFGYRYGFNGKEMSNEIKGLGNSYMEEFWEYDSRLGSRWNLDPKPNTSSSPYSVFAGNPILFSDPRGDTARIKWGGLFGNKKSISYVGENGLILRPDKILKPMIRLQAELRGVGVIVFCFIV